MAKRELLILAGFGVAGVLAYQLTAPPPRDGTRRFSWTALTESWQRSRRGTMATASRASAGTIPLSAEVTELRLSQAFAVIVSGEPRNDIGYTLSVDATASDEVAAARAATATALTHDQAGSVLAVAVTAPAGSRQTATLTLQVPARLAIRVDGAQRTTLTGVAAAYLDGLVGEVIVTSVAGPLQGSHRSGTLAVVDAHDVSLTLTGSKASFDRVRGHLELNARNGEARVDAAGAGVDVEATSQRLVIVRPAGPLRVSMTGGDLTVEHPRADIRIDARRASIGAVLDALVPVTIFTTERVLRLSLPVPSAATLDAASAGGRIVTDDPALVPVSGEAQTTLQYGSGNGPRITLRNQRGDIEITALK